MNNIRKNIYRIAAVFTAVCTLNFVPAPASAQQENVYLYEDFNSYPTNESETKLGVRTYSWTLKGVKYICTQKNKKSMH